MPISAGALAGIAAGTSLLSGGIQYATAMKSLSKNKKLAKYQHDLNLEAWREQNAYNSPEQQMQRLKDAGLNPHLVYGGSSGQVAGDASSYPQYQAPTADLRTNVDFSGVINQYLQTQMVESQLRHVDEQIEFSKQQRQESMQRVLKLADEMNLLKFDYDFKKLTKDLSFDIMQANKNKIWHDIEDTASRTAVNRASVSNIYAQAAKASAETDRILKMTPHELKESKLRQDLLKVDKTVKDWQVTEIASRINQITQQIAQGKVAQAYQAAETLMKTHDALELLYNSIDNRVNNPLTFLLHGLFGAGADITNGNQHSRALFNDYKSMLPRNY